MTEAATTWLASLDATQQQKACFAFEDIGQRSDWAYFPRNHAGLPLHDMGLRQQKLAHALLTAALSGHAYAKVTAIMALESVLNAIEGRARDAVRDPGRYFFSIFGEPAEPRWGWRCEGHHVSVNFTFAENEVVSATPVFLGANPAEVRHGHQVVSRPCGEEEDVARELLASLDSVRRDAAIVSHAAPPDFVLGNAPAAPQAVQAGEAVMPVIATFRREWDALDAHAKEALCSDRGEPKGLAARHLDAAQRTLFWQLIDVYLSRAPDDLAAAERAKVERAGFDNVHFAWAGSVERGQGHYYRIQGGDLLVEYDNTQDGANHVHAVWRDMSNDFGIDALRRHLGAEH
jgi:hypothetical protein